MGTCSFGGAGHWGPLSAVLGAARDRGDDVVVVAPPSMGDMVTSYGFAFVPGDQPDESVIAPIREQLPVVSAEEASVLGNRELFGRLATTAMLPAMASAMREWSPDLVVRDPTEYASAVVAGDLGIPTVQVAISLAAGEANSIAVAAPALDEFRPGLADELMAMPYLSRFPASVDPSAFATTVRYSDRSAAVTARSAVDWWAGVPAPRVYVTFGTVLGHMTIAGEVFRAALDAVRRLGASGPNVLFTVGVIGDVSSLGDLPPNVRVEQWIPQADVLPKADLVVCHGGSGTVLGALGAGVPVVVFPLFADQFDNARVVATSGAGLDVRSDRTFGTADVDRLSDAIAAVQADPSYGVRARAIGAEMAATIDAGAALDLVAPDGVR